MDNQEFIDKCKVIVVDYANAHLDKSDAKVIEADAVIKRGVEGQHVI